MGAALWARSKLRWLRQGSATILISMGLIGIDLLIGVDAQAAATSIVIPFVAKFATKPESVIVGDIAIEPNGRFRGTNIFCLFDSNDGFRTANDGVRFVGRVENDIVGWHWLDDLERRLIRKRWAYNDLVANFFDERESLSIVFNCVCCVQKGSIARVIVPDTCEHLHNVINGIFFNANEKESSRSVYSSLGVELSSIGGFFSGTGRFDCGSNRYRSISDLAETGDDKSESNQRQYSSRAEKQLG